jgi:hypothetical protein
MKNIALALIGTATLVAAGCGSEGSMMTGPEGGVGASPALMSVSPGGGSMGVPAGTPLEFHWGTPMALGMEQYVDLHMGDLSGPVVPMSCAWTGDQTALVCTPGSPLQPRTQYMVHLGGGMVDENGQFIDMEMYGPGFGGQWIQGGMMGTGHAGTAWGMMGGSWRHSNGAYGMAFTFTTA